VIHCREELVYINPAGAKLLGAGGPEELVGKPMRDFVHPDYWDLVQSRVQRAEEEGEGVPLVELKLVRLDGSSVEVETAGIPIVHEGQPALQSVIHDITARRRAEAERERERNRIARDLHDSLGHSLGYLHLKLDQLAGSDTLGDAAAFRRELAHMRDVTNEAYELVRGMLAALHPSSSTDLATAVLTQARVIGRRGGFEVQLSAEGRSSRLAPTVQQQVLYLLQEALINVERHANAQHVDIKLLWTKDLLTVVLADDGCGFEMGAPQTAGHYGLGIMQERADELNAQLSLSSRPGAGMQVNLQLPLGRNKERVTQRL
jgi:PAS domain S-box-containing protein